MGLICADLMVRASDQAFNGKNYLLHPRFLLEELKAATGSSFSVVNKPGKNVRLVHDGELYESQVSTMKCSTLHECHNVLNMRTWWKISVTNHAPSIPPLDSTLVCKNCGKNGHLLIHCAEKVGYIRLIFSLSHVAARTVNNITVPRHFPEAEPAYLLLPLPTVLPADDLVDALFNLP